VQGSFHFEVKGDFMEGFEAGFIQMELKYCERCGGLWLRVKASGLVFCGPCAQAVAGLLPRGDDNGADTAMGMSAEMPENGAFWVEGGQA
jgi:hypothetical protein